MKTIYKRQKKQYLFAMMLGGLGIVNILFFFIMYNPAQNEYYRLQESIERLQREIETRHQNVEQREKVGLQLETSEQDRQEMYTSHFLQRDAGFAAILPELEAIAQRAGVRKSRVDYGIDPIPQYGLYSVKIRIPVQGGYPNIVNFIQELENSDTFYIIEGIDLRGAEDAAMPSGTGTSVALALALETFFYQ